mgnify:CR=1 FL=1
MSWEVEVTDEFEGWWDSLEEAEQESISASVKLLADYGTTLRFPHSSGIQGSRHGNMRELRIQPDDLTGSCMPLTRDGLRYCCWAVIRLEMTVGMSNKSRLLIVYMTSIW